MLSKKNLVLFSAAAVILISCGFMAADTVRVKNYGLPPLFCIASEPLSDGVSRDYYGPGYKIWEDVHPFDGTRKYYVTFWFLPKMICI